MLVLALAKSSSERVFTVALPSTCWRCWNWFSCFKKILKIWRFCLWILLGIEFNSVLFVGTSPVKYLYCQGIFFISIFVSLFVFNFCHPYRFGFSVYQWSCFNCSSRHCCLLTSTAPAFFGVSCALIAYAYI